MTIGERIKQRRKELGISVDQLADKLKKNRATVYRYESSEIEKLPTTVLEPLADALQTTPAYLMGWEDDKWYLVDGELKTGYFHNQDLELKIKRDKMIEKELSNLVFLPLYHLKNVNHCFRAFGDGDVIRYMPYILGESEDEKNLIYVQVDNDKMRPMISKGDIVLVHLQDQADNDAIAVIGVAGSQGFISRYCQSDEYMEFSFINNEEFPPRKISLTDSDYKRYIVMGVVKQIIRNVQPT